ncbi:hypothetical protein SAMN06264346_12018 [Chryseobacterium profundimaris]|uniref:Uncharacterized protein n=2 Tax=Chryseobacterium profundimaris TaxID=1387275 RepID=A0ABY1PKJ4_9FLAO|nr:hypothetical protein SAMN06264346_12018 [Chryseobacterium profundimaris]
MFFIQEVDDFFFMVAGYIAGKENEEYSIFIDEFSKYLSKKYNFKQNVTYNLIIKSMTIYNDITLEILKDEMILFLQSKEAKSLKFMHQLYENKDIEVLLTK